MASFRDIVGFETIIEHLQRSIRENRVSHGYLISGEEHLGKRLVAESFAKALFCENHDPAGCGHCVSCRQVEDHNHPDVIYVQREAGKTAVSVDVIRNQVVRPMALKPYQGPYKVFLIDEAERMNPSAQNTLLKTLEEPPVYGVIVLLSSNENALLPTVVSRCVRLKAVPTNPAKVQEFLMRNYQVPDYNAKVLAAFSQGITGRAVRYLSSDQFSEKQEQVLSWMRQLPNTNAQARIQAVKQLAELKQDAWEHLDLMQLWFRDLLLAKSVGKQADFIYQEQKDILLEQAAQISYEGISSCLRELDTARKRIRANCGREGTAELLLLGLQEAFAN